MEEIFFGLEV